MHANITTFIANPTSKSMQWYLKFSHSIDIFSLQCSFLSKLYPSLSFAIENHLFCPNLWMRQKCLQHPHHLWTLSLSAVISHWLVITSIQLYYASFIFGFLFEILPLNCRINSHQSGSERVVMYIGIQRLKDVMIYCTLRYIVS